MQVQWRILLPKRIPLLTTFAERGPRQPVAVQRSLCLTYWVIARPRAARARRALRLRRLPVPERGGQHRAARRAAPGAGPRHRAHLRRGRLSDDTRGEIEREIERHADRDIRLIDQPGKGKGDAVRAGFAAASGDVLMILDADLSVPPEDLPKFYRASPTARRVRQRLAARLPDGAGAMRFLNMLGNKPFSRSSADHRAAGQGHAVRHQGALRAGLRAHRRGPRVLRRLRSVRRLRPALRRRPAEPQDRRPARPLPSRTYGETNISRLRHGTAAAPDDVFAYWKFRVRPSRPR